MKSAEDLDRLEKIAGRKDAENYQVFSRKYDEQSYTSGL